MQQSKNEDSEATVDVHFTDLTDSLLAWKVPVEFFAIDSSLRVSNIKYMYDMFIWSDIPYAFDV